MFPFVREAYAQGAAATASSTDMLVQFAPFILIFAVFYFLIIRPQNKQRKEHQAMLAALGKGDKVVTAAGIHGTIFKIGDEVLTLEIADKVRIQLDRSQIARVVNGNSKATSDDDVTDDKSAS
jgi:preprotein translocase subunit YajC